MERDPTALRELLRDLTRRFGKDLTVKGENSPEAARAAGHNRVPLFVDAEARSSFELFVSLPTKMTPARLRSATL
jgi:hypothetical protein